MRNICTLFALAVALSGASAFTPSESVTRRSSVWTRRAVMAHPQVRRVSEMALRMAEKEVEQEVTDLNLEEMFEVSSEDESTALSSSL